MSVLFPSTGDKRKITMIIMMVMAVVMLIRIA